jgi:hypothetical protein
MSGQSCSAVKTGTDSCHYHYPWFIAAGKRRQLSNLFRVGEKRVPVLNQRRCCTLRGKEGQSTPWLRFHSSFKQNKRNWNQTKYKDLEIVWSCMSFDNNIQFTWLGWLQLGLSIQMLQLYARHIRVVMDETGPQDFQNPIRLNIFLLNAPIHSQKMQFCSLLQVPIRLYGDSMR